MKEAIVTLETFHSRKRDRRHCFPWTFDEVPPILVVVLPVLFLLVVPSLTWGGAAGGLTANVGGDVPNTLFLNPGSFLVHMMSQHTGNGLAGADTFLPYLSLAVIALIVKALGLAPQLVISGLVLALTYLGVYVLALSALPRRDRWMSQVSAAVGASIAVLAPLIAQTLWTNFEPRLYLLPLVPWVIYALVQFIRTGSPRYLLAGAAMTVVCSAGIADIPGSLSAFLLIVIVVVTLTMQERLISWMYALRFVIFAAVAALVNAFWIMPFALGLLSGQSQALYSTSASGQQAAIALVASLVPYQQLSDVLGLRVSVPMMEYFTWPQLTFASWYQRWWLVGYFPFALAIGGSSANLLLPGRQREGRNLVFGLLVVLLVMLGFLSLSFPPGAHEVFDFLTLHLPGWVSEKNFYDTFAIPYVVAAALAGSAGFYALARFAPRVVVITTGLVVMILVGVFGAPLLAGEPYRNAYYSASSANRVLSSLPSGYSSMVSRITKSGTAPVLSLPLLEPAWTYLVGKESNGRTGTYIGIPPLYYLYGVPDYVGVSSFTSTTDSDFSSNLDASITNGRADVVARVIRMLGIQWVISDVSVVHQVDFGTVNSETTPAATLAFSRELERDLGSVTVSKDGRYSLLKVPGDSSSSVISIDRATRFSMSSNGISQVAAGFYDGPLRSACPNVSGGSNPGAVPDVTAHITHSVNADSCFVALRVPYSTLWSATLLVNGKTVSLVHRQVYGFANGFMLPALSLGNITIKFSDRSSFVADAGAITSVAVSLILLVAFPVLMTRRRRDVERNPLEVGERIVT
jgi:hypothetical protein